MHSFHSFIYQNHSKTHSNLWEMWLVSLSSGCSKKKGKKKKSIKYPGFTFDTKLCSVIMQTSGCHIGSDRINISCHSFQPLSPSPLPLCTLIHTPPICSFTRSHLPASFPSSIWSHLGSAWTRFSYQVNEYLYHRGRSQDAQGAGENNHTEQTVLGKQRGTQ